MDKLKLTQIKSTIGRPEKHKRIIKALGFKRLNNTVVHDKSPQILGMVKKVNHLLKIEEINDDKTQ
ncbi:MAG: 50S ribosomal protein L30 [Candidatus Coatesbacteria bacterium]|nr:50S ribosomal protein L30 [Candidatus Coatesbacteria bacterium]